jgi:hypothetical protein
MSISAVGAADRVNTASTTNNLPFGWIARRQFFRIFKAASPFQRWIMPFKMYASAPPGTSLKKSPPMISHRWLTGVVPVLHPPQLDTPRCARIA